MPMQAMRDITPELLSQLATSRTPEPVVTAVGDLNFDTIHVCPPLEAERRVLVQERHRCLGGAAGVAVCGLARLGATVRLVTRVGDDSDGRELLEELRRRGIQVCRPEPLGGAGACGAGASGATAFTLIFTRPGEPAPRQVATFRGVLEDFSLAAFDPGGLFREADALYACNYFIMPRLSQDIGELFAAARAAGVLTVYDANAGDGWGSPARLRTLTERIYPHADLVFLNEDEAIALSRGRSLDRALRELCPAARGLVIKRGGRGALVRHRGRFCRVGAFPLGAEAKDAVGAGDSFQACFLYFFLTGASIEQSALLGAANAASTLRHYGGTAGQLDRAGLRRFLSRFRVFDCGGGRLVVEPRDTE